MIHSESQTIFLNYPKKLAKIKAEINHVDVVIVPRAGKDFIAELQKMTPLPKIKVIIFTYNPAVCKEWATALSLVYAVCGTIEDIISRFGNIYKTKLEITKAKEPKRASATPGSVAEASPGLADQTDLIEECYCPITHELMVDPVIAPDGITYEKVAVKTWFDSHDTSPLSGAKLQSKVLIPNITLKKIIASINEKQAKSGKKPA